MEVPGRRRRQCAAVLLHGRRQAVHRGRGRRQHPARLQARQQHHRVHAGLKVDPTRSEPGSVIEAGRGRAAPSLFVTVEDGSIRAVSDRHGPSARSRFVRAGTAWLLLLGRWPRAQKHRGEGAGVHRLPRRERHPAGENHADHLGPASRAISICSCATTSAETARTSR